MKTHIYVLLIAFMSFNAQAQTTLYLIGDSTVSDKKDPEINPETGWGQVLPEFFNKKLHIKNHAVNGRSTKSFIDQGRWSKVLNQLKKGDVVFIQFGHNDQKFNSPKRFTNPTTTYRKNLELFVRETRSKGAIPVLFTSLVRRNFNKKHSLVDTHGIYPIVVRILSMELNVPLIDLQTLSEDLVLSYGEEASKELYLHYKRKEHPYYPKGKKDNTHLSRLGATKIASLIVKELQKKEILNQYIN